MMTVYLNRENDGILDLYVTNGTVFKTGQGTYDYNSRDGFKSLIGTYYENDEMVSADTRANLDAKDWVARYKAAGIPVQFGNETVLTYEAPVVEEKTVKNRK